MDSQKAIARLPPEIFSAIFSLVPNDHSLNITRGLWPLGRVCSFWRSILLSDPTLWTHLNISGSLPANTPAQQDYLCSRYPWRPRLLSEYLSRSVNLSLHIAIDHAHTSVGSDLNVKLFYQTLYAESHRFASLSHCTSETMRMSTLPDVFDFPNLRHLTITLPAFFSFYLFSTPTLETCCISFDDSPPPPPNQRPPVQCPTNLRELTLKGRGTALSNVPIAAFKLATAPLTSLTIDDLVLSPSIIQTLPQTQELYITTIRICTKESIGSLIQLIEHRLDCGKMQHVTFSGYIYEHYDQVFWGRIDALNARREVTFTLIPL